MLLSRNKILRKFAGVLETGNFLLLKLLVKNPEGAKFFPGKMFRDYMSLVSKEKWNCKDIFEIFPSEEGVRFTVEHSPGRGIFTPLDELAYLAIITRVVKPKKIFEIGTFRGRTALNFALNSPDDCVVYTLDLPPDNRGNLNEKISVSDANIIRKSDTGTDYKNKDVEYKIKQIFGNSLEFDFSPYYREIDLVFIDGAHHYEAVKSDSQNALRMVKPGGFIIWHDFANYGDYHDVTRAIIDFLPGDRIIQIANTQLAIYQYLEDR